VDTEVYPNDDFSEACFTALAPKPGVANRPASNRRQDWWNEAGRHTIMKLFVSVPG